jgi:hypothetical protein
VKPEHPARLPEYGMTITWRLLAAVLLAWASQAAAQTTGTLIGVVTDAQSGKPVVGALVVATSPFLQGQQTALTDRTGAFRITLLPPGGYRLAASFDGYLPAERTDIELRLEQTLRANLVLVPAAVQMEEQVVKSSQARPVVDVGSADSGVIVTREFLDDIPIAGRGYEAAAFVAPTARGDAFGIAFAGSTSPENGYLLDGMNVAQPALGILGQELRRNFVQEIEVKTGNFMPEYGFSTGGILNVVTRSGSNELHGSFFASYSPGFLSPDPKSRGRDAEALSLQAISSESYTGDLGFEVGGPILKDRLWFYVGFSPSVRLIRQQRVLTAIEEDPANPGQPLRDASGFAVGVVQPDYTRTVDDRTTEYQLTSKLTWLVNENNTVTVAFTTNPGSYRGGDANGEASAVDWKATGATSDAVARYTSKLLEKRLTVELLGGWYRQTWKDQPGVVNGVDQGATPRASWTWTEPLGTFQGVPAACQATASGFEPCPVSGYATGGQGEVWETLEDRFTAKGSLTWAAELLGSHQVKVGVDLNRTRSQVGYGFTGGQQLLALADRSDNPSYRSPGGIPDPATNPFVGAAGYLPGQGYPASYGIWFQATQFGNASADRTSINAVPRWDADTVATTNGFYLQDGWSPISGLTVNAGIRWEAQALGVSGQPTAIQIDDNVAPRVQAIYDWTGQGRSKVSASWGRFFEAIPLDIANRAFQLQNAASSFRAFCYDPRTDPTHANLATAPGSCAIRPGYYDPSGNTDPATAITYSNPGAWSGGSSPGSVTPIDPGLKGQSVDMFGLSAEYEVLTDLAVGLDYQGRRLNRVIESIWNNPEVGYFFSNPGTGAPFSCGPDGLVCDPKVASGVVDPVTGRTYAATWPKPRRDFDALTLSARKNYSNRWQLQGSYTWSSLTGNYAGLATPDNRLPLSPNTSEYYDNPSNIGNVDGPLPGDATHQFKAFGSYAFDLGTRLSFTAGGAFRAMSGTPVSYLGADAYYSPGVTFILPRGSAGRTPLRSRLDLSGRLQYVVSPPYAIRFLVDVINAWNSEQAASLDQNWTWDPVQSAVGGQCHARNGASGSNPIGKALADCPGLGYLRTMDGLPVTINQNFGRPTSYQLPVSVRLGLELIF